MTDQQNSDLPELSGQVVPFGKYKGRPVAELASDDGYREWVLSQPWVRERFAIFYSVLTQGSPPPQHSPEHNEMQARFLDEDWCLGLMRCCDGHALLGLDVAVRKLAAWQRKNPMPGLTEKFRARPAHTHGIEFEHRGWDVFFQYEPAEIEHHWQCECEITQDDDWDNPDPNLAAYRSARTVEGWEKGYYKPAEPAEPASWSSQHYPAQYAEAEARYQADVAAYPAKAARYQEQRHYVLDHRDHPAMFRDGKWWGARVAVELKPDLGDDYPAVLRQVQGYLTERAQIGRGYYEDRETCDAAFLVVRRAQFTSVTWDQVRKIFATSGIALIPESSLAEKTGPSLDSPWLGRTS